MRQDDPHHPERDAIVAQCSASPHTVLGAHPATRMDVSGVLVRAYHPAARAIACQVVGARTSPLEPEDLPGMFSVFLEGAKLPLAYTLRFTFADGSFWEAADPYAFLPTVGELDQHLFNEGTHRKLYEVLGAHARVLNGVAGVAFAVWAPNAVAVRVVGEFNFWDGRAHLMRQLGSSGIFELFVPSVNPGALYKFELRTRAGEWVTKTDPMAQAMEHPPRTASRVVASRHTWRDDDWLLRRGRRDLAREPMSVYEVHLGSFARVPEEGNRWLTYRELATKLADHVADLGYTHVELMPITEFPFDGSWGYQVSGYYAATSRFGSPDDLRWFVDVLHQRGIGVILDWVPGHFPKDDFALRSFDGTALYEHADPRRGEHPDWGTLIFNYGRAEVRSFLISSALFWLSEMHFDGLRVDAVASMLYLDYSRKDGEWLPNVYGGRENLEAVSFLRELNEVIQAEAPGCFTVAEESTAWGGVTAQPQHGGLGFTFKWNMGWMHDTLTYLQRDAIHRRWHHDQITFAMMYEYSERFMMPLSHDEIVHGKGSLWSKMPGDAWQKLANLRLLLTYQWTRPGKKLVFMGTELAPEREWRHDESLDWHLLNDPGREALVRFTRELNHLYRSRPALWRADHDPAGFEWLTCEDRDNSVLAYVRNAPGEKPLVVVINFTPVPREGYRIGAPLPGAYRELFNSDSLSYGGSIFDTPKRLDAEPTPWHGRGQSLVLRLPPLGALILEPAQK